MILALCALGAIFIATGILLWKRHSRPVDIKDPGNSSRIHELKTLKGRHKTASILVDLVEEDGAGAWPPKANHDSWPKALRPYKDIYLELNSILPTAEPSLDNDVNHRRRNKYRTQMRKLLTERVNVVQVEEILIAVEAGNRDALPQDAHNGFYACVAVCRHAYRWATIPVVKVAQEEKIVDFPPALNAPWPYLQRKFGVTAGSGNNTANVLHNFNERGERVYKINVGMSDSIRSSEEAFFRMFYNLEVMAFPIYYEMVRAIISFEENQKLSCANHLRNITTRLRHLLTIFYENLTEARVSHLVWLSYVQGFQGWGVGEMVNGEFIKYDGLSGNHVLFFQALDAFLGMDAYLTEENSIRYIPINQRHLSRTLKEHCFRNKLKEPDDSTIADEMTKIVHHLKVFRATHRARVMPYLEQPAPERLPMTAGKSVLEGPALKESLNVLDQMLLTRLRETV